MDSHIKRVTPFSKNGIKHSKGDKREFVLVLFSVDCEDVRSILSTGPCCRPEMKLNLKKKKSYTSTKKEPKRTSATREDDDYHQLRGE